LNASAAGSSASLALSVTEALEKDIGTDASATAATLSTQMSESRRLLEEAVAAVATSNSATNATRSGSHNYPVSTKEIAEALSLRDELEAARVAREVARKKAQAALSIGSVDSPTGMHSLNNHPLATAPPPHEAIACLLPSPSKKQPGMAQMAPNPSSPNVSSTTTSITKALYRSPEKLVPPLPPPPPVSVFSVPVEDVVHAVRNASRRGGDGAGAPTTNKFLAPPTPSEEHSVPFVNKAGKLPRSPQNGGVAAAAAAPTSSPTEDEDVGLMYRIPPASIATGAPPPPPLLQPSRLKNPKAFSYVSTIPPSSVEPPRVAESGGSVEAETSGVVGGAEESAIKKSLANLQKRQKALHIGNVNPDVGNPFVARQIKEGKESEQHLRAHRWRPKN